MSAEGAVVIMHSNVDLISETCEDTATEKLQNRRFQPPHSRLMTILSEKSSIVYIAKISIFWLHFPVASPCLCSLVACSWPRNHMHNATYAQYRVMAVQPSRSSKVIDFATN